MTPYYQSIHLRLRNCDTLRLVRPVSLYYARQRSAVRLIDNYKVIFTNVKVTVEEVRFSCWLHLKKLRTLEKRSQITIIFDFRLNTLSIFQLWEVIGFGTVFIATYKRNDDQEVDKAIAESFYVIQNRFQAFRGSHAFHRSRQQILVLFTSWRVVFLYEGRTLVHDQSERAGGRRHILFVLIIGIAFHDFRAYHFHCKADTLIKTHYKSEFVLSTL